MKKTLSFILVLTLVLSALGVTSVFGASKADNTKSYGDFRYEIKEDGTILFKGTVGKTESLIVPEEIEGRKVTEISGLAQDYKLMLKSVVIPEGVTQVSKYVFEGLTNLEEITLPDSMTNTFFRNLDKTEFYRNQENWENGVLYIGNHLVKARNQELKGSYTIKEGTVSIFDDAFAKCGFLTEVNFPNTLKRIGGWAFSECTVLEKAILPDSVEFMDMYTFANSDALKEIHIPKNLEVIPMGAFRFSKIDSLNIPENIKVIEGYAFEGCESLTEVSIPQSVEQMGYAVFARCKNLEKITLSENLEDLGNSAFYGTAYANNKANWEEGCLYLGSALLEIDEELKNITVKEGTQLLPRQVFSNNKNLVSVTLPESVEKISPYCFAFSYRLRTVNLPESLKVIGECAFEDCVAIESIAIPKGVEIIEKNAFLNCQGLKYIEIPSTVSTIDEMALGYYNPYFEIDGMPVIPESYPILEGFTIAGHTSTAAEEYANDNNITFEDLSAPTSSTYKDKVLELLKDFNIVHYAEVYSHSSEKFVLIRAYSDLVMEANFTYYFNDYVMYEDSTSTPAEFGYFIYLPEKNEIYTLINAFEKGIDGVYDIFTQGILGDLTGDVNFDGKVNIRDATFIQKDVANKASVLDKYYMVKGTYDSVRATKIADFNRDGKLNIRDATAIQKTLARVELDNPDYENFENNAYENSIKHSYVTLGDKTYDLRSDEIMTVNVYLTSDEIIRDLTFEFRREGYIRTLSQGKDAEFIKNHLPNLPTEYEQFRNYTDYLYIQTPEGELDFREKKLLYTMDYQLDSEGEVTLKPLIRSAYSTDGKALCSHNETLNGADFNLTYEVTFERLPLN